MRKAHAFTMALALLGLALLIASGPGTRAGWWSWEFGLWLLRAATYTAFGAGLAALFLIILLAVPRWRVRPWVPVIALCLALVTMAPPIIFVAQAKQYPYIHDISTDTDEPPVFVALLEARKRSPNGAAYAGEQVAVEQRRAYPEVKPLVIAAPPREAMQRAIDAARSLGWEVVASDATTGRIEATDTTRWFGFKDDVIVRIRPEGTGSRIDVRSVSRVGESDVGANAKRIREFLAKLA